LRCTAYKDESSWFGRADFLKDSTFNVPMTNYDNRL